MILSVKKISYVITYRLPPFCNNILQVLYTRNKGANLVLFPLNLVLFWQNLVLFCFIYSGFAAPRTEDALFDLWGSFVWCLQESNPISMSVRVLRNRGPALWVVIVSGRILILFQLSFLEHMSRVWVCRSVKIGLVSPPVYPAQNFMAQKCARSWSHFVQLCNDVFDFVLFLEQVSNMVGEWNVTNSGVLFCAVNLSSTSDLGYCTVKFTTRANYK